MAEFIPQNTVAKQWTVIQKDEVTSGTPTIVIPVDPRRITQVEIAAGGCTYNLDTASNMNDTGDPEDVSQIWISRVSGSTDDFATGDISNRGFVAIRIVITAFVADFNYQVAQNVQADSEKF